jgi:hypothetical protein
MSVLYTPNFNFFWGGGGRSTKVQSIESSASRRDLGGLLRLSTRGHCKVPSRVQCFIQSCIRRHLRSEANHIIVQQFTSRQICSEVSCSRPPLRISIFFNATRLISAQTDGLELTMVWQLQPAVNFATFISMRPLAVIIQQYQRDHLCTSHQSLTLGTSTATLAARA